MEKTSKELLKEFVDSQHFTSTTVSTRVDRVFDKRSSLFDFTGYG